MFPGARTLTKELVLLLRAAVGEDRSPEAQHSEDERCCEEQGGQVDHSYDEGIVEAVIGLGHVGG